MAKLSDLQKKEIIADRIEGLTIRQLAKKYKVSTTSIQKIINSNKSEIKQKVTQKKKENIQSVLAHMDLRKNDICELIDLFIEAMKDKDKIEKAPLRELATAMGIIIDKYTANEVINISNDKENNLFTAIDESCMKEDFNEISEIQQKAKTDLDMVEQ